MILIEALLSGLKGDEKPRETEVTGTHQLGVSTCGTANTVSKVDAELLSLQWEISNVAGGFGRSPLISPSLSSTRDDRNEPARHSLFSHSFLPSPGRSDYQTITAATQISTQRWSHRRRRSVVEDLFEITKRKLVPLISQHGMGPNTHYVDT